MNGVAGDAPYSVFSLYSRSPENPTLQLLQQSSKSASTTPQRPIWNTFGTATVHCCSEGFLGERLSETGLQPFSQKSGTATIPKVFQIGLCGVVEADLELFWNSWSAGFLGERLYNRNSSVDRRFQPAEATLIHILGQSAICCNANTLYPKWILSELLGRVNRAVLSKQHALCVTSYSQSPTL